MKRFVIGLLVVGGIIAAIALIIRRRSGSDLDEWDSFAGDTYTRASTSVTNLSESAMDAVSKGSGAAKDAASGVSEAAKNA